MSLSVPQLGSKILVTGASGFLGIHVVKAFLNAGFKVVGTVRSVSKGEHIKDLFKGQPFEFVIVEDIGKEGAFDEAVKGIDGVAHTASPFHLQADDPDSIIRPAVDGTLSILASIAKVNPSIKRVVLTSSVASVAEPCKPPKTFTEADWNTFAPRQVEEMGAKAPGGLKYQASKTLAERSAWAYCKENDIPLVTICPSLIFGPILHQVDSPENINTSVGMFFSTMAGHTKEENLPGGGMNWVDVRDVAKAHVLALTVPQAANNRFITSASPFCTQEICDILRPHAPDLPNIPSGNVGAVEEANDPRNVLVFDGGKARKMLGVTYRSIDDTVKDMYDSIRARGW